MGDGGIGLKSLPSGIMLSWVFVVAAQLLSRV